VQKVSAAVDMTVMEPKEQEPNKSLGVQLFDASLGISTFIEVGYLSE
jgi:hypothetical protein